MQIILYCQRPHLLLRYLLVISFLLGSVSAVEGEDAIWNGFTFSPGVGLRHLGLDVTRKSDGFTGNIAQDVPAKAFITLNFESPKLYFGSSNWGLSIVNQNRFVTLDSQWYNYESGTTGVASGERIDVGSEVSGRYSYILPQIFYETGRPNQPSFKFALGYGLWNANMNGTIKLTADNQPTNQTASSNINLRTTQYGYLLTMSYRTKTNWLWQMSLGSVDFDDADYKYVIEEVTLTVGKTFMF